MTVKLEDHHRTTCDDVSNNNNNTTETQSSLIPEEDLISNPHSSVVIPASTGTNLSLDSVVQRLIDKKMGRRKQNCPQRTGEQAFGKSLRGVFKFHTYEGRYKEP